MSIDRRMIGSVLVFMAALLVFRGSVHAADEVLGRFLEKDGKKTVGKKGEIVRVFAFDSTGKQIHKYDWSRANDDPQVLFDFAGALEVAPAADKSFRLEFWRQKADGTFPEKSGEIKGLLRTGKKPPHIEVVLKKRPE